MKETIESIARQRIKIFAYRAANPNRPAYRAGRLAYLNRRMNELCPRVTEEHLQAIRKHYQWVTDRRRYVHELEYAFNGFMREFKRWVLKGCRRHPVFCKDRTPFICLFLWVVSHGYDSESAILLTSKIEEAPDFLPDDPEELQRDFVNTCGRHYYTHNSYFYKWVKNWEPLK